MTEPTRSVDGEGAVLVTGGAGFVGSALVRELLARGRRVVCLDITDPRERLGELPGALTFVKGDVRDAALVRECVAQSSLVLHLAAVVGVDDYIQRPHDVLAVNIGGTQNVLDACLAQKKPVLHVSTSEVYGRNGAVLREDSDCVIGPISKSRWAYAISKLAAEQLAYALGRLGLCFTIVRYFNVYGPLIDAPGQGRVISKFLGCIRDGRPLPLVDGGPAVRAYCYVDDAVEATLRLALNLRPDAPFQGRAVNIGRNEPKTVRELAELMIRLSGHAHGTADIAGEAFFGRGFEEIPLRVPDVSFLEQATGFRAEVPLEEGLRRTLRHWGLLREQPDREAPREVIPAIRPYIEPTEPLFAAMRASLRSGRVSNDGPLLQRFERETAAYLGAPDAAAVGNGAQALLLAVKALGLRGRVVLPSFTYIATLSAFTLNGLEPVFCDVEPDTFTLAPAELEKLLARGGIAAVAPVNAYGVPADLAAISQLARRAGATVVYDDCHGFGTVVGGRRLEPGADVRAFSFHATKVLPAIEGGLVVADDPAILREVRRLRSHGLAPDLLASTPGYNARMDELRAAVGLQSLADFAGVLERRRAYATRLMRVLAADCGGFFRVQRVPAGVEPNWQNLAVVCPDAERVGIDTIVAQLRREGIEARRYFWPPLHELEAYRGRATLPVTEALARSLVCLPLHSRMTETELERVEEAVRATARRLGG